MSEIDVYVNLIDDNELNDILELLQQNSRLGTTEFKKTKIKTMMKTKGYVSIPKKGKVYFDNILVRHKISEWETLNEKDFILNLQKSKDKIPDYKKFANLVLKYPENKDHYVELINENKINNKYIFDFNIGFESNEEAEAYFNRQNDDLEELFKSIKLYFSKAVEMKLIKPSAENIRNIKKWELMELNSNLTHYYEGDNIFVKFQYLRVHKELDKVIFKNFCIDIMLYLVTQFEVISNATIKAEMGELKSEVNKLNIECKKYDTDYKKAEKEHKDIVKKLNTELSSYKLKVLELTKLDEQGAFNNYEDKIV